VLNDPANETDPQGTNPWGLGGGLGGAIIGGSFGAISGGWKGAAVGGTSGFVVGFAIASGIPPAAAGAAGAQVGTMLELALDGKSLLSPEAAQRLCTSTLVGAASGLGGQFAAKGIDKGIRTAGKALNSPAGKALGRKIGRFLLAEEGSGRNPLGGFGGEAGGELGGAAGGAGGKPGPVAPNTPKQFQGHDKPWTTGATPNSTYTHIDPKTGKAVQNAIYDQNGNVIGHVDFKNHGTNSPSGHGHTFPTPGNPASGHDHITPPIPYDKLPPGWGDLPPGVSPRTPIGN